MAPKVKSIEPSIQRPTPTDVQRAVQEASRHRKTASEYSGEHGGVVKRFTDRWGTNKKAFGWARSLYDMEPDKRQSTVRDFLELTRKLGFLDQGDLFEDLGADVDKVLDGKPDLDEVKARTEAEQAEAPEFVRKSHAQRRKGDRIVGEIDDVLSGTVQ